MRRKITGFLLLLGLSLVLALWGCAAKPEEQAVSGIKADEAAEALLSWAEKATGEPCNAQLQDFKAAVSAKLLRNGQELWSARTPEELDRLSALLDACQGSTVSNFDGYDYALCCTLEDGTELNLYLSSDEGTIFLPPFRYYKLPQESPLRDDGWLQVFGWEEWPGENDYTSAGAALRDAMDQAEAEQENIAARYKDKTVSWTEVDYANKKQ